LTEPPLRPLVVNADDLGLHVDLNRGIEEAHVRGIVTSASISAVGEAFDDAAELCHRCPELDVGVHLTLVEERPLTSATVLEGLVDGERFVRSHRELARRALAGRIWSDKLLLELDAQIERILGAGIRPTHVDSHQHVHLLPGIWPVVVELTRRYEIRWLRVPAFVPARIPGSTPSEVALRLGLNVLRSWRRRGLGRLTSATATPALAWSGHLTVERILEGVRGVAREGVVELVTHPGFTTDALLARYAWGYDWTGETEALTAPELPGALAEAGFAPRSFRDVA